MPNRYPGIGEPAPWFEAHSPVNPRFQFDSVAGRYVVLCFFGSAGEPASHRILHDILEHRHRFDDDNVSFFAVSIDPEDQRCARIEETLPGLHVFWDFDLNISRLFGVADPPPADGAGAETYCRVSVVLDERLRVLAVLPFDERPEQHVPRLIKILSDLPPLTGTTLSAVSAPILIVPRVFEPELCRALIGYYEKHGGQDSGFMRDIGGKTVEVHDHRHKRRRDQEIIDEQLRKACMFRIHDRLAPEIYKAFQFRATRIERYIVACYDSANGGHFQAHRDNKTKGTEHRRFAVSLNLNTEQYQGGLLRFPEFGRHLYQAPAGGAVVFSCSLLHEATRVTDGRRYAFLPFLYDDAAAQIRERNRHFVADNVSPQSETVT